MRTGCDRAAANQIKLILQVERDFNTMVSNALIYNEEYHIVHRFVRIHAGPARAAALRFRPMRNHG
jgi:hypothetical protein